MSVGGKEQQIQLPERPSRSVILDSYYMKGLFKDFF